MIRMLTAACIAVALFCTAASARDLSRFYTGQIIHVDDGQRAEVVVIKRGDNIWRLCISRDWCRRHYPEQRSRHWLDFVGMVQTLNPEKKNINLLYLNERIIFPLGVGALAALDELDNVVKAGEEKVTGLSALVAELKRLLGFANGEIKNLKADLGAAQAENRRLNGDYAKLTGLYETRGELIGKLQVNNEKLATERDARWEPARVLTWLIGAALFLVLLGAFVLYWGRDSAPAPRLARAPVS